MSHKNDTTELFNLLTNRTSVTEDEFR